MQVDNLSASNAYASSGDASEIAILQKQLVKLVQQLKDVATSTSMDAKAKQQQVQLLQVQMSAIQNQIASIQNQKVMAQLRKAREAEAARLDSTRKVNSTGHAAGGSQVDTYV